VSFAEPAKCYPGPKRLAGLAAYMFNRRNVAGVQQELWCHRLGCELWFLAERDTRTNGVLSVVLPGRNPA